MLPEERMQEAIELNIARMNAALALEKDPKQRLLALITAQG